MSGLIYKYDYRDRIMFKYYFGLITVENVKESWRDAIEKKLIPGDVIGFVLDYRSAHFDIKPGRHIEIPEFYQQYPHVFHKKRVAIVTENPEDIVYPMLIQTKDKGYMSEPFSTVDAAISWIWSFE